MNHGRRFFIEDAVDGDGDDTGGGAGGDEKNSGGEADVKAQLQVLTQGLTLLANGMKEQGERFEGMFTKLVPANKGGEDDEDSGKGAKDLFEGLDLEQMDRKQFATTLLERAEAVFGAEMKKQLSGVDERIGSLSEQFQSKNAGEQVKDVASKNADFWEWSGEIKTLLKETPSLSVQRAYALAKAEAPDKVAQLSKKYSKAKPKDTISLLPTSSRSSGTAKMTPKEAADKAFDTIMGDLGDGLSEQNIA